MIQIFLNKIDWTKYFVIIIVSFVDNFVYIHFHKYEVVKSSSKVLKKRYKQELSSGKFSCIPYSF